MDKTITKVFSKISSKPQIIAVVEDNSRSGGTATGISQFLRDKNIYTPQRDFGIPEMFLQHASRAQVMSDIGLTAQDI